MASTKSAVRRLQSVISDFRLWVPTLLAALTFLSTLPAFPAETTVYVNKFFEVRDHDQPVKYVFHGDTRVARVSGSLSANARIQRLRLHPGWNLCAVAVEGSALLRGGGDGQSERVLTAAYKWSQTGLNWLAVSTNDVLEAGTILWLHATTNTTLALNGTYTDPTNRPVASGGSFQPGAGLEVFPLPGPGTDVALWHYDASIQGWQTRAPALPGSNPGFPEFLDPGEAIFMIAGAPAELEIPEAALRVRYYHQDHLGSSSVMTDAEGALVEETAFYPFGTPRNEHRLRLIEENYQFTQKERDRESDLHYFGRRFYHSSLGRWLSTDPEEEKGGGLNLYAYARQNPLKYVDPDGGEITVTPTFSGTGKQAKITHYQIHVTAVLINLSPKLKDAGYDRAAVQKFADTLKGTIEKSYSSDPGKKGKVSWSTTVDLRVIDKVDEITQGQHVFRLVDDTYTRSRGVSAHGGLWMEIKASALLAARPAQEGSVRDYLSPESTGAHELGHTGGLDHWQKATRNLMQEGDKREYDTKTITLEQIETIYTESQAGHLNQGSSKIGSWEYSRLPKEKR